MVKRKYRSQKWMDGSGRYVIVRGSLRYGKELPNGQFRVTFFKDKSSASKKVRELNKRLR